MQKTLLDLFTTSEVMELLPPDQTEKKRSIESKLSASITRDNESDGKLRKNSSDSEPAAAAVKTKPQQSSSDLIRIFGGTAVPLHNYEISDSDMESEEEGDEVEQGEEKKKETKLNIFKGGLAKKIVTLTEEKKGGRIGQLFRLVSNKEFSTQKTGMKSQNSSMKFRPNLFNYLLQTRYYQQKDRIFPKRPTISKRAFLGQFN